jgi:hypothetical protein
LIDGGTRRPPNPATEAHRNGVERWRIRGSVDHARSRGGPALRAMSC